MAVKPCQTPGCDHPRYHVCLVGKPDTFPMLLGKDYKKPRSANKATRTGTARTLEEREALSEAQKARWAKVRLSQRSRNEQIVARYSEGNCSIRDLMEEFDVSLRAVTNVLYEARDAGLITVRKRGETIAKSKKR